MAAPATMSNIRVSKRIGPAAGFDYFFSCIPVAVLFEILQDASDLFNYYADLMMEEPEFILALALNKFLPNVYDMLIELEIIKDYYVDLPDTPAVSYTHLTLPTN